MEFVFDTLFVIHEGEDRLVGQVLHLLLEVALLLLHLLLGEVVSKEGEAVVGVECKGGSEGLSEQVCEYSDHDHNQL